MVDNDGGSGDLLPVAGAGLRLLLTADGRSLRQRLLLLLVKDNRLSTDDLQALLNLLRRTFGPRKLASQLAQGLMQRLNPLAAA